MVRRRFNSRRGRGESDVGEGGGDESVVFTISTVLFMHTRSVKCKLKSEQENFCLKKRLLSNTALKNSKDYNKNNKQLDIHVKVMKVTES